MLNIELYARPNEYLDIRIGKITFRLKFLYKLITNCLSLNFKKNIVYRLNSGEFLPVSTFKNALDMPFDKSGLDNKSLELLDNITSKIKLVYGWRRFLPYISFYTKEEHKQLKDLYKNFYRKIINNPDGTYQYDNYKLPVYSFEASVLYYKHGLDSISEDALERIKHSDIIDAGAYIGDSALVLSEYTNKNVYSFECCCEQFEILKKTIELNKKENIIPVKFGLGEKTKEGEINIYSTPTSNSLLNNSNAVPIRKETIQIVSLDDFVKKHNINVGLIKSDIEGMEQNLIKGALETIKKFKPVLIISIYHSPDDFCNIKPMIDKLNLGYKFKLDKPVDGNIMSDTVLIAYL